MNKDMANNTPKETQAKTSAEKRRGEERREMAAATTLTSISSPFLKPKSRRNILETTPIHIPNFARPNAFTVRAAKLPAGVEVPKVEPKLSEPFFGFTETAEIWNSRACMIGLIGTFIVELIFHKGILQMIGVDVGKGLDIPL